MLNEGFMKKLILITTMLFSLTGCYVAPAPVVVHPAYVAPAPVYVAPAPVVVAPVWVGGGCCYHGGRRW